jgi:hypothetical protein
MELVIFEVEIFTFTQIQLKVTKLQSEFEWHVPRYCSISWTHSPIALQIQRTKTTHSQSKGREVKEWIRVNRRQNIYHNFTCYFVWQSLRIADPGVQHWESLGVCTVRDSKWLDDTTFRKLDLFLSSGEGIKTHTLLGCLHFSLSKGSNRVNVSLPSPEDGNRSSDCG